jgi:radical SAM superfamily enzyme YgiQ (UPF0313 family)
VVAEFEPDIVGISAMTHQIVEAYAAAAAIKGIRSQTRIVLGGPHATARPCETLEECAALDAVCFGEGEQTFAEVAARWSEGATLDGCAGVAARVASGGPRESGARPWLRDLDSLPFPAWDLFPRSDVYPVMSTRGCPYRCNFCCRAMGDKVRKRSPANTVNEIEWLVRRFHPRLVRFEDETLTWNRSHALSIVDGILSKGLDRLVEFSGQTRVDRVDRELFLALKRANFRTIEMGVESGSPRILAASGKHIDLEQVVDSFAAAHEVGLRTWAKFILGHPHETPETVAETIDLASRINPTLVSFAIMVPYPGTEIWNLVQRGEGGYRLLESDWSAFDKFLGNAIALEHLSRSALERWQVRGYTTVYLRNRRYRELIDLVWSQRKMAFGLAAKLVSSVGLALLPIRTRLMRDTH